MGVVDYAFYSAVYMGTDADPASFPALCARASEIIGAVTHWADNTELPTKLQTLYKKAVCAQIDFLAINGTDAINETASAGWTVGKVTIHAGNNQTSAGGKLSGNISPMAIAYLEQTGLMNPQVPTLGSWW